jgi:midasin
MFITPGPASISEVVSDGMIVETDSLEASNRRASTPFPSTVTGPINRNSIDSRAALGRLQVCGIELPLRQSWGHGSGRGPGPPPSNTPSALILTSTTQRNLEAVALGLCQGRPVLLEGPPGAGKSAIIDEVARVTGNHNVIKFHLDDQTDSKTLLGSYVCTEVPGEFRWQAGALTQAVAKGIWVVFEDVDCAPFEVLSALILLLEDRQLYIPGRGEVLTAAPNFQVFGTVTTRTGRAASTGAREVLGSHWARVSIAPPEESELVEIATAAFPEIAPLVEKMTGTLHLARVLTGQAEGRDAGGAVVRVGRLFTARDLLKWARRVAVSAKGMEHLLTPAANRPLPQKVRELVYAEAVDCLAGAVPKPDDRRRLMQAIATDWGVLKSQVEYYSELHKPGMQVGAGGMQVGRASLQAVGKREALKGRGVYAQTGHTMRLLERVGVCVQQNEPALLVGETGTGKTALVQFLARQVGARLMVLNMSQQTDSADFLGGFKPVEVRMGTGLRGGWLPLGSVVCWLASWNQVTVGSCDF